MTSKFRRMTFPFGFRLQDDVSTLVVFQNSQGTAPIQDLLLPDAKIVGVLDSLSEGVRMSDEPPRNRIVVIPDRRDASRILNRIQMMRDGGQVRERGGVFFSVGKRLEVSIAVIGVEHRLPIGIRNRLNPPLRIPVEDHAFAAGVCNPARTNREPVSIEVGETSSARLLDR